MTSPVATALALSVLLQLIPQTCAQDPTKIFLILDNKAFKEQYGSILKRLTNTPIKWHYGKKPLSQNEQNEINKAGKKILYISAMFEERKGHLTWGTGQSAEKLAEIVSNIFPPQNPNVFVTVVFPKKCLKTTWGYEFVDKFIQNSTKNIGIGIPRVEIYVFADQKMLSINAEITEKEKVQNITMHKTINSIFFKLEGDKLALYSSKKWIEKTDSHFDSILNGMQKMKIEEAEMVIIHIKADCVPKYKVDNVAAAVISILGTKRHEHQQIKIKLRCLPEDANQEERRSNILIDQIKTLTKTSIYGQRPNVVIYLTTEELLEEVKTKSKTIHGAKLYQKIEKGKHQIFDNEVEPKTGVITSAKEISLEVHCHGLFFSDSKSNTICNVRPQAMAKAIAHLFSGIDASVLDEKRIEVIMYACNAGTTKGQTYVTQLLEELNKLYNKPIIDEVISFVSWVVQNGNVILITVPVQLKFNAEDINNNHNTKESMSFIEYFQKGENDLWQMGRLMYAEEHIIYGRFTVQTKRDGKKYIPVLPASEYEVYKLEQG